MKVVQGLASLGKQTSQPDGESSSGGEKVVQHFNDYMKGAGVFVSRETRTELHSFYSVLYTSNSRPIAL